MGVSTRFEEKHAFVLRPTDIHTMWDTLQKRVGGVQAQVNCSDSIEREFATPEDLLRYENPRSRAITRLTLNARSKNLESRISISFGERYGSSIEMSGNGPEESIVAVKNALGETVDGVRPWFAPLARIDFFYVIWGMFIFTLFVLQIMVGESKQSKPLELKAAIKAAALVVGFLAVVVAIIWGLNRLRRRYFPIATFAIGQGESRYYVDENVRWVVIVGFLVSIFSSLVGAFLWGSA